MSPVVTIGHLNISIHHGFQLEEAGYDIRVWCNLMVINIVPTILDKVYVHSTITVDYTRVLDLLQNSLRAHPN